MTEEKNQELNCESLSFSSVRVLSCSSPTNLFMEQGNVIVEKSIAFSIQIIGFCEELEQNRKYIIARQLLKSGTSIGANVFESQHAESKTDFIHKMKIAIKEANETLYWLILCESAEGYPKRKALLGSVKELIKILSKIILSTRNSLAKR